MLDHLKGFLSGLIPYILAFLIGFIGGVWLFYDHMKPELNEAKAQLKVLQAKYETKIEEKEKAQIELALEQQKKNAEVNMNANSTATYAYKEKKNPSDPDVVMNVPQQSIKIAYNGDIYNLPLKRTTLTTQKVDGQLCMYQESVVVIDVTDIVNREIANTILTKDAEIEKLKHQIKVGHRQVVQHTFWSGVIGTAVGALLENQRK